MYKLTISGKITNCVIYFALTLLGFITLYPFIYVLALSFNNGIDAMKGGIYFVPRVFTLENYAMAFKNKYIVNSYMITLFRTSTGTLLSLLLTSMAAYGLTRKEMPFRSAIIFFCFFTTLFSGGFIPYYLLLKSLGLLNNIWIYVLPSLFSFYYIIIVRTYFQTIPNALRESAQIDGLNDIKIFFKIYVPLSAPMLATIALFIGVGHWNDWAMGTFFVTKRELQPTATLLQFLLTEINFETAFMGGNVNTALMETKIKSTTPESLRMAFLVISTVPILMLYPFLQKFFVHGVMIGSIKE